jgi:Zn-dependent protease/predicted transcriptional regulator
MSPRRSIDLFKIAGIQIAVDYSWLVIFLLVLWSLSAGYFPQYYPGYRAFEYWSVGLVATLLFFASVLIHELSHSLVANRLGQQVRRITLFIFGGMAHLTREPKNGRTEFLIAVVGPLTSLALGGIFWLIGIQLKALVVAPLWTAVFDYLAFINVALGVFNLLPGFPLDGGRLLRSILWMRSGDLRSATARAANWGSGIAVGLMLLGALQIFGGALMGGLWLIFIGMFLRGAAQASYHGVVVEQALSGSKVRELMIAEPVCIPADTTVEQAIDEYFLRYGFGGFPVIDGDRIVGIVSLADIKRCAKEERGTSRVDRCMQPAEGKLQISAQASVADALRRMVEVGNGRLLVTDGTRIVGLLTHSGIARFTSLKTELEEEQ